MILVRANNQEGREVIRYAERAISVLKDRLTAIGLPESVTNELRGRVNELQKLIEAVHNTGEDHAD